MYTVLLSKKLFLSIFSFFHQQNGLANLNLNATQSTKECDLQCILHLHVHYFLFSKKSLLQAPFPIHLKYLWLTFIHKAKLPHPFHSGINHLVLCFKKLFLGLVNQCKLYENILQLENACIIGRCVNMSLTVTQSLADMLDIK